LSVSRDLIFQSDPRLETKQTAPEMMEFVGILRSPERDNQDKEENKREAHEDEGGGEGEGDLEDEEEEVEDEDDQEEGQEVRDDEMSDFAGFADDGMNEEPVASIDDGDNDGEELDALSDREWTPFNVILFEDPARRRGRTKPSLNDRYAVEVELRRRLDGTQRRKRGPIPDAVRQQGRRIRKLTSWPAIEAELDKCVQTRQGGRSVTA
jgi:hypothetical protein